MALFTGQHENKIDKKGRISLPADFRAELPEGPGKVIYVFPSPRNQCLEAVDRDFIQDLSDRIREFDMFSDEEEDFSAVVLADAKKTALDETGRITMPTNCLEHAGLTDKALFVGGGRRFQIWHPDAYQEHARTRRERARSRTLPPRRREHDE